VTYRAAVLIPNEWDVMELCERLQLGLTEGLVDLGKVDEEFVFPSGHY